MQKRKRHLLWLSLLGAVTGIAIISGVSLEIALLLLGLFGAAAVATLIELRPREWLERSRTSLVARRMSAEAREAVRRARRPGGIAGGLVLLDIGMISMYMTRDGVTMRRTRSATKDEDGIRPFATIHALNRGAEREVVVRWEMLDRDGEPQYIHEMKYYLRAGDNNIIPDHHLPLAGNSALSASGEYDLRVFIDGILIGEHPFTIVPTYAERFPALAERDPAQARAADEAHGERGEQRAPAARPRLRADDSPMSLEDLLRSSNAQPRAGGQQNSRRS